MKFIALKTENGRITGKTSFYCKALEVSRQGLYEYLKNKNKPWKYEELAAKMIEIREEDEYNDTYGRVRMREALILKKEQDSLDIEIPEERTIYRIMQKIGISHRPRKPKGLTKADKKAQKSDDLLKRNFKSEEPNKKCVTDITELKASNGKLYISAIFDCFDLLVCGLAMDTNMKAALCIETVSSALKLHPELKGTVLHSDRGSQYTSDEYRRKIAIYGIRQSMNSAGGRCHDNARCESMWAGMKVELFYSRKDKLENYTVEELKTKIWRYYMSYWNNRRICSANGGMPPALKRRFYYQSFKKAA
ncbi:MAG: IS3 family transposase [Clostridia bacterium]|nr:IS3 family transposase [Clostridia bacterium]